jgi:hypothetical protein
LPSARAWRSLPDRQANLFYAALINKKPGAAEMPARSVVSARLDLQADPHVTQVVSIKLPADQTNAGNGNDDENNNDSKYDHGDLLFFKFLSLYIFNAVPAIWLRFLPILFESS